MGLLAVCLLATEDSASAAPKSRAGCEGIRLLADPYLLVGVDSLVLDVSGPVDDRVQCQRVKRSQFARADARAASKGGCKKAGVSGAKLKPRLAAKAVRCLIDKERTTRGLGGLKAEKRLKKAAKKHSSRMVSAGCFAHTCPGEPDLFARLDDVGYLPCTCAWSAGENIAWGQGKYSTPAAIVDGWMASSGHRAMILNGSMREVNVGIRRGKPGDSGASAATYTADFGYRN